ncbi:MAG: metallophosphoesterase [Clostridiales bacterium]|nr:metallophosphoesterase [Clostridiales bacterium]
MKIIVMSDTHGMISNAEKVLEDFKPQIDGFMHLGDHYDDAQLLRRKFSKMRFWSVRGNCDFVTAPTHIIGELSDHRMYICHGHREDVKYDRLRLVYKAAENDCDIALYGHTHVPEIDFYDGVLIFNPGSLSLPRQGLTKTFGLLDITEDGIGTAVYGIYKNKYKRLEYGYY